MHAKEYARLLRLLRLCLWICVAAAAFTAAAALVLLYLLVRTYIELPAVLWFGIS